MGNVRWICRVVAIGALVLAGLGSGGCYKRVPVAMVEADGRLLYLDSYYAYTADVTAEQRQAFEQAMKVWSDALGGGIRFQEIPNTTPSLDSVAGRKFLGKCVPVSIYSSVPSTNKMIIDEDKKDTTLHTVGLTLYNECGVSRAMIVQDRIKTHDDMVEIAAHEIGHALGLDHVDDKLSIMYAHHNPKTMKCLTSDDAEELCDHLGCLSGDVELCRQ